jgi:alpha-D-xyloside xylohydrolase
MSASRFNRREFAKKVAATGAVLAAGSSSELATVPPEEAAGQSDWLQAKKYLRDVLGTDLLKDKLFRIGPVASAVEENGDALFTAPLITFSPQLRNGAEGGTAYIRVRLYGDQVVRVLISRSNRPVADESPMLEWSPAMKKTPARLSKDENGWVVWADAMARFKIGSGGFAPVISPDGTVNIEFQAQDHFVDARGEWDSFAALFLDRARGPATTGISLYLHPGEHFCGTGERFDRIDLFGRQIDLVNVDALGVNNERAYKNIPFLMSSRRYGLFAHSTARMRLDIGHHSTRALQWLLEDDALDMFFIGGGRPERVLFNYRSMTGFPKMPPVWSFGVWMSRMTYHSDKEVSGIAARLRKEQYPFDVLHVDTGWFATEWKCDWTFSKERFPDPPDFFRRMREQGFRVSLWQYPYVNRDLPLAKLALEKGYVGKPTEPTSGADLGYTIDFTNPAAMSWYQGMLERLLEMGASAIKADFGESIDTQAIYKGATGAKYGHLFPLLYQRAVWEVTNKVRGENIEWARSGWAGSQRYPVHWGGDSACTFDGLAGTICGGMHLGLSGFGFWSHDVPGFYGVPNFMTTRPSPELYIRWTQAGTFTSHMRYHGSTPREPWEYPSVSDIARQWLRLRYALLPYLLTQAEECCRSGYPMFRSLVIEWPDDATVWVVSDEYMLGDAFLVCPVLSPSGERDVYLPTAKWVDFWNGGVITGPQQLKQVKSPLSRLPLYVRYGARVEFAEPVQYTDQLRKARRFSILFDNSYSGFDKSEIKSEVNL